MELKKLIREPRILTFVTTYKCSSACTNCCFQCSPIREEVLSYENIIYCLQQVKRDFPSIKIVVLTGGECTLLNYLSKLIQIIKGEYGYSVRIVTNAHWASTQERAQGKVLEWKESGLDEMNISTGDEHLKYVPIDYVKNAIIASTKEGFVPFVNIETAENHKFNFKNFASDNGIQELMKQGKLLVANGLWINFKDTGNKTHKKKSGVCIEEKCSNMFNSITITPDCRMKACCGITSNYIKYLDLGDPFKYTIRTLYDRQFSDFMKIWIASAGPHKIMDFISEHNDLYKSAEYKYKHPCEVCAMILNDPYKMEAIKDCYKEIYANIIIRHLIGN